MHPVANRTTLSDADATLSETLALLSTREFRLYRVEGLRERARGSAGLGLALCSCTVSAHGGEIAAKPSPLGGLWIEIALPLAQA